MIGGASISSPFPSLSPAPSAVSSAPVTADPAAAMRRHSARCRPVLLKSCGGTTNPAAAAAAARSAVHTLQYEAAVQAKLDAAHASEAAAAPCASAAAAVEWPLPVPAASPFAVRPHLRAEPQLTLVLEDCGGELIRSFMSPFVRSSRAQPSHALPPLSSGSPGHSSSGGGGSHYEYGSTQTLSPMLRSQRLGSDGAPTQSHTFSVASVRTALRIALAVAVELQRLHSCRLVHGALSTSSVLLEPRSGRVQFIDLASATAAASPLAKGHAVAQWQLSLQALHARSRWLYAAPEASGKANRSVDARTDLYSLGAILHELLCGHPPFAALDPLELIHCHLAKAPPSLLPRGSLPSHAQPLMHPLLRAAQAIVSKLLQKQAEDRYQSAQGLIHDLRFVLRCIDFADSSSSQQQQQGAAVESIAEAESDASGLAAHSTAASLLARCASLQSFVVGQLDQVSTFRLSQKLYGREESVARLRAAYARVAQRQPPGSLASASSVAPRLMLLSGYSGVGKTSVVEELLQHLLAQRGLFARGKFDLYQRDSSCLPHAFRHLIQQLIVRDAVRWKADVLHALGSNGAVLCAVLPELTRLIDEQPEVPHLGTAETANRFNMVLLQFINCVASAASPLVLFIDDLQWADLGSLSMLRTLLSSDCARLLLIGAYRDNEVDEAHPLTKFMREARAAYPERVEEMQLAPLSVRHICELIVDSFRCEEERALPLARLLHARTQGNPFHLTQLLNSSYDARLLQFDFGASRWQWDMDRIRTWSVANEDVIELVCKRMSTLSADAQTLLKYASCSGHRVALNLLFFVTRMPLGRLSRGAVELKQAGMLLCVEHSNDLFLLAQTDDSDDSGGSSAATGLAPTLSSDDMTRAVSSVSASLAVLPASGDSADSSAPAPSPSFFSRLGSIVLQFAHDKIQAAALQLIPAGELSAVHCVIATQLMDEYEQHELEEYGECNIPRDNLLL